ncbi:MAG: Spy/CpxP family protein refolding chaperone [Deltaproteobacteria bacterium]|nr:MAG: Spy/CpxP family protein refolding chaperone [Deltaproteobacteria bacterium]
MKKLVTIFGILVFVAVLTAPVFAHRWGRGGNYGGPGSCWSESGGYGNLTESQRTELEKLEESFFNDTVKLREEIWSKSAELNTALNAADPDVKKIRTLQGEISALKAKMSEQRVNFELEARKIAPNARYGRGYGRGYAGGGYGYGMGRHHGPHGHCGQYGDSGPYGGYGRGGYGPCWN